MVRPRTSTGDRDREMAEAGARFETYVKAAMAEAGLPTLAELYRQSGIGASTWNAWFRGLRQPRANSLRLAGEPLHKTPEQLLAAWDGQRPHKRLGATQTPDPLSALTAQTQALAALVDELRTWRSEDRDRLDQLESWMDGLVAESLGAPDTPTATAHPVPDGTAG